MKKRALRERRDQNNRRGNMCSRKGGKKEGHCQQPYSIITQKMDIAGGEARESCRDQRKKGGFCSQEAVIILTYGANRSQRKRGRISQKGR